MTDHERVGCWLLRHDDGETRLFGSIYPVLAENWSDATITTATWHATTDGGTDR